MCQYNLRQVIVVGLLVGFGMAGTNGPSNGQTLLGSFVSAAEIPAPGGRAGHPEDYRDLGYLYLSLIPGAEYTPTGTQFILVRFTDIVPEDVSNLSSFITVEGANSGSHAGQVRVATDGRTVLFGMSSGFAGGEVVTVRLAPTLKPGAAGRVAPYQYSFIVGTHFPDPDRITARGEDLPAGAKENAFDGNLSTSWMDRVVPDGNANFSWIQFIFPGIDQTRAINRYTLTSGAGAPERDPRNWRLYGVDASDNRVLLDTRSDEIFNARGEKKAYSIPNTAAFRGYRLEILRVNDPDHADAVQLAELEFDERPALLREYWMGIPGNSVSALTSHSDFPANPAGRDYLARFETQTDWADAYGTRVRGYVTAPVTGNYVFWIASDDNGELWLSGDENPANRTLIASVPVWTSPREWGLYASQKSNPIPLTAGERYYIEALQKEGSGGDNLAVGWARPGQSTASASEVIPGAVLSPWIPEPPSAAPSSGQDTASKGNSEISFPPPPDPQGARIKPNGVSIPSDFPQVSITVNRNPSSGYIFIPYPHGGGSQQRYVMMLDNNGDPVWYKRGGGDAWNEFKIQKNDTITMEIFNGYDNNLNWLKRYQTQNGHAINHHDLEVLEDGGYLVIADHTLNVDASRLVIGGNPNASVTQTILQEYTAADELIFQFRAWDHYDVADVHLDNNRGGSFRFPHINAIDVDDDGHLVISCRHLSEVTKINRHSGQIIWRLSGAHSDFTFVNDPLNGFWNQHDVSALGNGRYMVFDNGNGHNPPVSRAVEYQLDLHTMTATKVWEFRDTPDKYSHYMGNAQRLPNGNTLINFVLANYPKIIEVNPQGVKEFEMNLLPGSDAYRAFRFPWNGKVDVPYLIVEAQPEPPTLIFNKFGDPDVDHYRIYGRRQGGQWLLLMTSPTTLQRIDGLEDGGQYDFRVTAVSRTGTESGPSNEVQNVTIRSIRPGQNLLINGDFSKGKESWTGTVTSPAVAEWKIEQGISRFDITNGGQQLSQIQLFQAGLPLVQTDKYIFEFTAWSDSPRSIEARIGTRVFSVPINPNHKFYRYSFSVSDPTNYDGKLVFNLGYSGFDVFLDDIYLAKAIPGDVDSDGSVGPQDLSILASEWLGISQAADLNRDGVVKLEDAAFLSEYWMKARPFTVVLIPESAPKRILVPTGDIGRSWIGDVEPFNDSAWLPGIGGVGYENSPGDTVNYTDLISVNVKNQMYNTMQSCYIRIPFALTMDPAQLSSLVLNIRCDDGFVAYINGKELARERHAAPVPVWNTGADSGCSDSAARVFQPYTVNRSENPDLFNALQLGNNILAIHGLNHLANSSDFLISAELNAGN